MQPASSASWTWRASASAWEKTATVRTPSSRQARMIRTAISPRLAIRTLENTGGNCPNVGALDPAGDGAKGSGSDRLQEKQGLPEFHGLAVLNNDPGDPSLHLGLDLVHELHGFDD